MIFNLVDVYFLAWKIPDNLKQFSGIDRDGPLCFHLGRKGSLISGFKIGGPNNDVGPRCFDKNVGGDNKVGFPSGQALDLCQRIQNIVSFYGKVHVAYIPDGKIIGLSKIPRIVEVFARRLQVQERMTQQIADTLEQYLQPKGVAVVSEAHHMCMMMRGVEKQNSSATSSAVHGDFKDDPRTRAEFLNLISQKNL